MALTHIDCFIFRGEAASPDTSSFVALNPRQIPGTMVIAGSSAARDSISSQVACKLAIEHFVDGVLDYYDSRVSDNTHTQSSQREMFATHEISVEVLEAAFKKANSSVYSFGHKLAAGGRMAASLIGVVIEENIVAAGRVAAGSAYLYRQGELFPFFDTAAKSSDEKVSAFIGANSLVSVELSSVPIQSSDSILVFSRTLHTEQEALLLELMSEVELNEPLGVGYVAKQLFGAVEEVAFVCAACIGPDTIYLGEALAS